MSISFNTIANPMSLQLIKSRLVEGEEEPGIIGRVVILAKAVLGIVGGVALAGLGIILGLSLVSEVITPSGMPGQSFWGMCFVSTSFTVGGLTIIGTCFLSILEQLGKMIGFIPTNPTVIIKGL
jgi:hypothetical protein